MCGATEAGCRSTASNVAKEAVVQGGGPRAASRWATPTCGCSTGPASSPRRSRPRRRASSGSSPGRGVDGPGAGARCSRGRPPGRGASIGSVAEVDILVEPVEPPLRTLGPTVPSSFSPVAARAVPCPDGDLAAPRLAGDPAGHVRARPRANPGRLGQSPYSISSISDIRDSYSNQGRRAHAPCRQPYIRGGAAYGPVGSAVGCAGQSGLVGPGSLPRPGRLANQNPVGQR